MLAVGSNCLHTGTTNRTPTILGTTILGEVILELVITTLKAGFGRWESVHLPVLLGITLNHKDSLGGSDLNMRLAFLILVSNLTLEGEGAFR